MVVKCYQQVASAADGGEVMSNPDKTIADKSVFSLRDKIAVRVIQAMAGLQDQTGLNPSFIADYAYQVADAAMKRREMKPKQ